ncbi:MAG: YqgE/AlgH family protein [Pseudomonadota bacterium]
MDSTNNLCSQILIAMPSLNDPNFAKTITLICEHSPEQGAMGIVLNLPTSLRLNEMLGQIKLEENNSSINETYVHFGGPVGMDQAFVLHADDVQYESTLSITNKLSLSASKDAFSSIAQSADLNDKIITLGYAGWTAGQLESEISANSWLVISYEYELVFNTAPSEQWIAAGNSIGINLNLLKCDAGHA